MRPMPQPGKEKPRPAAAPARARRPRTTPDRPGPVPVAEKADHHRKTRRAHATEIAEDYVEMIADLIDDSGEARVVDLARGLGVSHVTVVRTLSRLQRDGLVQTRPYRSIFLTDDGRSLAQRVRARHDIVVAFLHALGVSADVAHADAEGIEHHVSRETLAAFERFVQRHRS